MKNYIWTAHLVEVEVDVFVIDLESLEGFVLLLKESEGLLVGVEARDQPNVDDGHVGCLITARVSVPIQK